MRQREPEFVYRAELARLPKTLRESFLEFGPDEERAVFLEGRTGRLGSYFRFLFESLLSPLFPAYEIHGLLGLYPMYLLGERQWSALLGEKRGGALFDVGAGQGFVTEKARPLFPEIWTTETSHSMARILRDRGFTCIEKDLGRERPVFEKRFDVVSLLNVLDRCDRPLSMIGNCARLLKPDGYFLIALPLPLRPYIRKTLVDARPEEALPALRDALWEECLAHFCARVIEKNGFEVVRWTRLPYLWKTTLPARVDGLDDAVIVCRRAAAPPTP